MVYMEYSRQYNLWNLQPCTPEAEVSFSILSASKQASWSLTLVISYISTLCIS